MKKIIAILAAGVLCAFAAQAQTTNTTSFVTSAELYFTSFNTNYTFASDSIDFETGYKQVTGTAAASFATGNYYITTNFEAEASITYAGVGSAINGGEAGVGYAVFNHYDTRLTVDLLGGYDAIRSAALIEPKAEVKKKLTPNTFASLGLSLPIEFRQKFSSVPTFWTGVGFTF